MRERVSGFKRGLPMRQREPAYSYSPASFRVQTVAGSGRIGQADGPAETATFSFPTAVLPLADGSCLVSDTGNNMVRHVSVDARGGYSVRAVGSRGFTWLRPRGLAQLPDGGVLVCDSGHNRIRLLGADGSVSVFAGNGRRGRSDGSALGATFDAPVAVCVCADGSVLVCDGGNHCIRAVKTAPGSGKRYVETLAGSGRAGCADGPAAQATFDHPSAILALGSASGLEEGETVVYVADSGNHCMRVISLAARTGEVSVSTLCGRPTGAGHVDGGLGDGLLTSPMGLAQLPDGALAVTDAANNNLRRIDVRSRTLSTLAGSADKDWGLVDGSAEEARFNVPKGLAVGAASGEIWIADAQNHCIRVLREERSAAELRATAELLTNPMTNPMGGRGEPPPTPMAAWTDPMAGDERRGVGPLASVRAKRTKAASPASPGRRASASVGYAEDERLGLAGGDGDGNFASDAQLFERALPSRSQRDRGIETRGGWTYTGPASVTLRPCPPRAAAMLSVQVHGAATAEVSVVRPGQLVLRDTAFVVCTPEGGGGGFTGFGCNELGLRFSSTAAAASLLAACEALVGEVAAAHGQVQAVDAFPTRASLHAWHAHVRARAHEPARPHGRSHTCTCTCTCTGGRRGHRLCDTIPRGPSRVGTSDASAPARLAHSARLKRSPDLHWPGPAELHRQARLARRPRDRLTAAGGGA